MDESPDGHRAYKSQKPEDEKNDGRLHSLEVRVKAEDAKGKTRKLIVSSRQGYYMPGEAKETTASSSQ